MPTPSWAFALPWNVISVESRKYEIDPRLIAAVIMAESSGQQWATRYEKHYRWLFNPAQFAKGAGIAGLETEVVHQKTSWGLMQVLGAVAREAGFKAELPKLCVLNVGMQYGCIHLRQHLKRWGNIPDAIAGYNAGAPRDVDKDCLVDNHVHVERVLGFYRDLGGEPGESTIQCKI